jgi:DNA adenine methylase
VQEEALPVAERAQPFVKWAGGKRQLLPELLRRVPRVFSRYHEPFVGGGALFFALRAERPALKATLTDVNQRLIRTYLGIQRHVDEVIGLLSDYKSRHDEAFFYEVRSRDIDAATDVEVAAWFIYLNKTGFNGLYRVNSRNVFNVPFGRYVNPGICNGAALRACSRALRGAEIEVAAFDSVAERAREGDFVYFDPPYVPLSATSSFTSYTSGGFGAEQQTRLCEVALSLKERGVHVLLSNSAAPFIKDLYESNGFRIEPVQATRQINSKASDRGAIAEFVIT